MRIFNGDQGGCGLDWGEGGQEGSIKNKTGELQDLSMGGGKIQFSGMGG